MSALLDCSGDSDMTCAGKGNAEGDTCLVAKPDGTFQDHSPLDE